MTTTKVENRGGAREGAGRKPIFGLSEDTRRNILRDLDEMANENGTTLGKELGGMIFGKGRGRDKRTRMQAIQAVLRDVLTRSSERDVNVNHVVKPQVYIPEQFPDSAEAPEFKPAEVPHIDEKEGHG